jgi:branched-chain amino acid transport system permease protein
MTFGPITFIVCAMGGLGNMLGGFIAAFVLSEIIAVGGLFGEFEWGHVYAFIFFILIMIVRPQGLLGSK